MRASAASSVVPGVTKCTSRVITSESGVFLGSRPARTTRIITSRSVKIPARRRSSVLTTSAPMSYLPISSTASATLAEAGIV